MLQVFYFSFWLYILNSLLSTWPKSSHRLSVETWLKFTKWKVAIIALISLKNILNDQKRDMTKLKFFCWSTWRAMAQKVFLALDWSKLWEARGLMVSELHSGSSGLGSNPGQGHVLCSWARHLSLTVPLSAQVYKWELANLMLGVTLWWTSIPSKAE